MTRILATVFGITVLALLASGLAEASLALNSPQTTSPEPAVKATVVSPKVVQKVTPATTPTPASTPTPTPATPTVPTATVNGFVHMRASATTSSAILLDLNAGNVVQYSSVDAGLWQAVTYHGQAGYVYKSYLNY
jgi:uncharacterized protein YgiM (DUF1202 family)